MKIKIHRNIIWVVVLYGCEAWSLTLREKQVEVLKNRELRKTFWCKRDKVTGEWRRLHNKELYDLCTTPNFIRVIKSRRMIGVGHVALMGDRKGADRGLGGEI